MERTKEHAVQPKLIRNRQVAALAGVSTATIGNWADAGLCPKPIRIGNGPKPALRFREDEILDWIKNGCPAVAQEDEK